MTTSRRRFLAGVVTASVAGAAACSSANQRPTAQATSRASGSPTTMQPGSPGSPGSQAPASSATSSGRPTTSHPDLLHGPRTAHAVALTFHGQGPAALTKQVLAEAAHAGAGLTVLAVGTWLDAEPALARAILDGGHDLGNHTWSHRPMRRLDAGTAYAEISRAATLLKKLTGTEGRWFRPSGTPRSTPTIRREALRAGYSGCLAYDVDPEDYKDPGAATVRRRVHDLVRPGSVVSLHLGHPGTVQALPGILADLHARGLRPVTASALLGGHA